MKKTATIDHNLDALFVKAFSAQQDASSNLIKSFTTSMFSNSRLSQLDLSVSHDTSGRLIFVGTPSHYADTTLLGAVQATHSSTSSVLKLIEESHDTQGLLKSTSSISHDTSILKILAASLTNLTDSQLIKAQSSAHNTSSLKLIIGNLTIDTDSLLKITGEANHFTSSGLIKALSVNTTNDGLIFKTQTLTNTAEATLRSTFINFFSSNSELKRRFDLVFRTDVRFERTMDVVHTTNSHILPSYDGNLFDHELFNHRIWDAAF